MNYLFLFCLFLIYDRIKIKRENSVLLSSLKNVKYSDFDSVFAEDMCKPLPEWYNESKNGEQKNESIKKIDENKIDSGFYLPGFFEVFPELKLKYPIWSKNKKGGKIRCEKDDECKFPETCCINPFLPGEKFCCTGFGNRRMIPAYVFLPIIGG